MAQKTDAESCALVGAFDEARQIRHDEGAADRLPECASIAGGTALDAYDTEVWLKRGEWIIRNLGARSGNHRNQSGFSSVGETNEADVGEKFELEAQVALFAGMAIFVFARCLVPGFCKILIAASAAPAMSNQNALAGSREVGNRLSGVFIIGDRAY